MTAFRKTLFVVTFSLLAVAFIGSKFIVKADTTEQQLNQQKSQKQQELNKILKDISAISSSSASISSKLKELRSEKKKLETLLSEMSQDLKVMENETAVQEQELVELANKYSLQQALYSIESQKGKLVIFFESPDLSQVVNHLLFYNMQTKLIEQQRDYINLKKSGIDARKAQIAVDQTALQKSLSDVSQKIADLENQQGQINASLSRSYAQRSALVSDISKLTKAAQAIVNKKVSTTPPTTGGNGGGSTVTNPKPSVGSIAVYIGDVIKTQSTDKIRIVPVDDSATTTLTCKTLCPKPSATSTPYAGALEFNKKSAHDYGIYAINDLPIDKYLWGLAEMPSSWQKEALKVQAVAGRSYAVRKMTLGWGGLFDIWDDYTHDQEYNGLAKLNDGGSWKAAVDETSGEVVKYGNTVVLAYYSADNGGGSLSGAERGFGNYSYLPAVSDRFLKNGIWTPYGESSCSLWIIQGNKPNFPWCGVTKQSEGINTMALMQDYINGAIYYELYKTVKATSEQSANTLANTLGSKSIVNKVGKITSIRSVYNSGDSVIAENTRYTAYIEVVGDKGKTTVSGDAFKTSYNVRAKYNNAVYSTLYDIKKVSDDNWELWTRGFGHRVGMSQYGAKGRAAAGQSYQSILSYYYGNANVVQYSIGRNIRVALSKVGSRLMTVKSTKPVNIYNGSVQVGSTIPANTEIKIEYN